MTSKLCLTYLDAGGNVSDIGLISAFLNCCIYYMKYNCNPEDFCLNSLFKFAEITKKSQLEEFSTFDIMIQDGIEEDGEKGILEDFHQLFYQIFTPNSTKLLLDALDKIRDKLMERSQNREVWFGISNVD